MSKPPEEWWTSTLLARFGPRNPFDRLVLVTVDALSINGAVLKIGQPELAEAACMDVRTLKASVKRLKAAGLLTVMAPPGGYARGRATRYHVERDPLVRAAVAELSTVPEKGDMDVPLTDMEGGHGRTPSGAERGTSMQEKGDMDVPPGVKGVEREGVARARAREAEVQDGPPPRRCRKHSTWKGDHNCHDCRRDRMANDQWEAGLAARRAAHEDSLPDKCDRCGPDRKISLPDGSVAFCPHCNPKSPRYPHQLTALVEFPGGGESDAEAPPLPEGRRWQPMGDVDAIYAQLARARAMPS